MILLGNMLCVMEYCFFILTPGMTSEVYRVGIMCRIWDGKIHYVK
jgi:hypothetical protein